MSRARIERGDYVYPLSDGVGDPEDAEGWSADSEEELEAHYGRTTYAPEILDLDAERRPVEADEVGIERDEAWAGRRTQQR